MDRSLARSLARLNHKPAGGGAEGEDKGCLYLMMPESGGAGGEGVQVGLGGRWKGWGASVSIDERGSDDP